MESKLAKRVEVVMENHGSGKVVVDGVELGGVVSVEVFAGVNRESIVSVTRHELIRTEGVTFTGPAVVNQEVVS